MPLAVAVTPLLYVVVDSGLFLTRLDDNRGCLPCRCRYAVLSDVTVVVECAGVAVYMLLVAAVIL